MNRSYDITARTLLLVTFLLPFFAYGQGRFSGSFQMENNFFDRDTLRGAAGTPHYDNYLSSTDAWLNLNYSIQGFDFEVRFDAFHNSDLHDPQKAYSAMGLGYFQASKQIENLKVTGGYFYDQFGSGLVFRAYEERALGIDKAILGLHLQYDLNDNWRIKAFTGRQKNRFDTYKPILKGGNLEGFIDITDGLSLAPGAAIVNRTLDQNEMELLISEINDMPLEDRFVPKYNVYSYSAYNRLNFKDFSWYAEYVGKTKEAIRDKDGDLVNKPGSIIYSNASYSRKGFGLTLQYRRVDQFVFRTSPFETQLDGVLNYLPTFARQNSYRLPARYNAVGQNLGEIGYRGNLVFTPERGYTFTLNYSDITDLDRQQLFREAYFESMLNIARSWKLIGGFQFMQYNQEVYENKPNVPVVEAYTPFLEFSYKLTRRKSIRTELQYQHNEFDYGSWLYGLVEFNIAPKYSFSVSDMYNFKPKKTKKDLHYYTLFASYTKGANKFSLGYVKQVEGIVCTGGVCRYEPAFSGAQFKVTSTF